MVLNKPQESGLIGLSCISYTLVLCVVRLTLPYLLWKLIKENYFSLLYVDDVIVTGSNPSHVLELVLQLGKKFSMNDLGPLHFFLGIGVNYFEGGIHLNQSKYGAEMFAKTEMSLAKAVATPLARKRGLHEIVGSFVYASF